MRLKVIPVTAPRLIEAAPVLSEITATPDRGIPEDMLANAHCAVIVPGLKTAFLVGCKYGKGYVSCCTWSRSQEFFAGLALGSPTLRQDLDSNSTLYGGARAEAAAKLPALLNKHSARERSSMGSGQ